MLQGNKVFYLILEAFLCTTYDQIFQANLLGFCRLVTFVTFVKCLAMFQMEHFCEKALNYELCM